MSKNRKRIQAQIDRSIFVTSSHLQTEFEAMKELYDKLADLNFAFKALRPIFRLTGADETEKDRFEELNNLMKSFSEAYNKLLKHYEALSPFYPPELYTAVDKCLTVANRESVQIRTAGPDMFRGEWWNEAHQNQEEFVAAYKEAGRIIRERVASLAVLPGT